MQRYIPTSLLARNHVVGIYEDTERGRGGEAQSWPSKRSPKCPPIRRRHGKQTYGDQRGRGRRINQEFGIRRYTRLYTKQINKVLVYSTGNYIQHLVIIYKRKESEKQHMCN